MRANTDARDEGSREWSGAATRHATEPDWRDWSNNALWWQRTQWAKTDDMLRTATSVSLVVMPFGPVFQPALGASILREALGAAGLRSRIEYLSIRFAEMIGVAVYDRISEFYPDSRKLFGEWLFSHALYPGELNADSARRHLEIESYRGTRDFEAVEQLCRVADHAGSAMRSFMAGAAADVLACAPKVVGFSSMFQQHTASLALARELKALSPETFIVFGGANAEGSMGVETLRAFAWVDAVVSGAGEVALPAIARAIAEDAPPPAIPGVTYQRSLSPHNLPCRAPELPLDEIPPIHFDDFFRTFARAKELGNFGITPSVLVEMSRGCWWGQKHHCTFCGLNGADMHFRMKTSDRAISDLRQLRQKYPASRIVVTDNIMPQSYYRDVLPRLSKDEFPAGVFFEIKSNVTKDQVRDLALAGIDVVQVGIENFSPNVLNIMRKGVSATANVACLKYCAMYGIVANWILLMGFPGESADDYNYNYKLMNLLRHLQPPQACSEIRIDRFSPNHNEPSKHGFSSIKPLPAYAAIYRDEAVDLSALAYYFDGENRQPARLLEEQNRLRQCADLWEEGYPKFELWVLEIGEHDIVLDSREGLTELKVLCLDATNSAILRACETRVPMRSAFAELTSAETQERLAALEKAGVLFHESGAAIALPLRVSRSERRPSRALLDAFASTGRIAEGPSGPQELQLCFDREDVMGISYLGDLHGTTY